MSAEDSYRDVLETMQRVHASPDGAGTVKCPRCQGTVHYEKRTLKPGRSWSRGKCETERCVAWIV